ncbi:MAG: hypothetical protein BYD32DRAFT_457783 [Podila humilis]|nr:MAG: hypothetical protein BYD32DRAFT_457783 [Podila humilis]
MFGADRLVLEEAVPELVERAFGRIKIVDKAVRTVLDEPFVFKAAENYFKMLDPGFMKTMGLQRGISHEHITMEGVMNAHVNNMKLRQILTTSDVKAALKTVSAPIIETHMNDLGSFCPTDNTFINMITAYPATVVDKLPPRPNYEYKLRTLSKSKQKPTQIEVIID